MTTTLLATLCAPLCAAVADETMLCNGYEPAQWIDVRIRSAHDRTKWWAGVPAEKCSAFGLARDSIFAEARDLAGKPVPIRMRCFPIADADTCIVDNKR